MLLKNKRISFFTFIYILTFNSIKAQLATGDWRMHISTKAIGIASNKEVVMAIMENGVIEYDLVNNEISQWSKVNGLSDINPSSIIFDSKSNSFFIGYQNGNIDKIYNNSIINIPALKLATVQGSKKINGFYRKNNDIFIATDFGILVLNPSKNEIKDTYYPNETNIEVIDIAFKQDSIIAIGKNHAKIAHLNNPILVDHQQWINFNSLPELQPNSFYKNVVNWNDDLYVLIENDGFGTDSIYSVKPNQTKQELKLDFGLEINRIKVLNDQMYVCFNSGVFIFNKDFELVEIPFNFYYNAKDVTFSNNNIYIAENNNAIYEYNKNGIKNIKHNGPPNKSFFSIDSYKDKMLFTAGTLSSSSGLEFNPAGAYVFEKEVWTHFNRDNQALWKDKFIWDIISITNNPKNPNQIAIGSYCDYPLAITNDSKNIVTIYDEKNSIIEETSFQNGWSCVTDLKYDKNENLWMLNSFSKTPLKVLGKDSIWHQFSTGMSNINKLTGKIIIDENNLKWFFVPNDGLYVFSEGTDLTDKNDDKYKLINDGQNTGALPSKNVTSIAMDYNNSLWIGTEKGFGILNNTNNILEALPGEYNVNRIKLEFEGNVEYLLGNAYITDIEVDGGNRKWIGTANSGIILLSESGNEILQTFTIENSPLISNNIMDMEFNGITGELFIVTDLGLISFRTDSSTGDDSYSNVKVFPNPVLPNYEGQITIQGIKYDSDVKFTDISGNLVYQTTSNGGTATWNGKNVRGEKVSPGTYLIWTASNTEKGRKVGKVVIIN